MKKTAIETLIWILILCHFNLLVGCSTGIDVLKYETPRAVAEPKPISVPERHPETQRTSPRPSVAASRSETKIPSVEPSQPEPLAQERQPDEKNRIIAAAEVQIDVARQKATIKPAKLGKKADRQRALAAAGVVTNLIRLNSSNFKFDPQTKISSFDVTLINISQTVIFTPIKVTIQNLRPSDIRIVNADGGGNANGAFWDYSNFLGGDDRLSPNETSAPRNWQFFNPRNQRISFLAQIEGLVNSPPRFISTPVTRAHVGQTYLYPAQAVDPDADSLTYALIKGPQGMTIVPSDGSMVWNPTSQQLGAHPVEIKVNDPHGGSDTQSFNVAVNRPPQIISIPITAAKEQIAYSYDVDAVDPDGDPITYALAKAPAGMTINSTSGLINWTPKIDSAGQQEPVVNPVNLPDLAIQPSAHDFGKVPTGASASQSFVVRNHGTADLVVSAISLAGANIDQFAVDNVKIPFTLAPGDTQKLVVSFKPTTDEPKSAALQINSDDPDTPTLAAPLTGNQAVKTCFPDTLSLRVDPGDTITRNVSVKISPQTLSCLLRSTFDQDDEGWRVVGDAQAGSVLPTYVSTGGNPGGYISARDDVLGGTWYWEAPAKFLGNLASAYGQTLTFELRQTFQGGPSQFDERDVILKRAGARDSLVYDTPNNPGPDWTAYAVRLDESAGWRKNTLNGPLATKAEMLAALSSLAKLRIRGEYRSGADFGDLDNVGLNCPANLPQAPQVEVFFIVDLSSGFGNSLAQFKAQAPSMVANLAATGLDIRLGLARFEDYPIGAYGSATSKAYERVIDLTPPQQDSDADGTSDFIEAINGLSNRAGGDTRGSQLPAVFQAATGAGQNLSPLGFPGASIPPGQGATLRLGALPIFVLWTNSEFHEACEPGSPIPYPGPDFTTTLEALNARNIKLIGILAGSDANARADLEKLASGTSTFAPPGGVDCDGNTTVDVAAGKPLVCSIPLSGTVIGTAVVSTVRAVALTADIALKVVDNPATSFDETMLVSSITPASFPNVNLNAGGSFNFNVTFTCPVGAPRVSFFKLESRADGASLCEVDVDLTCRRTVAGEVQEVIVVAQDTSGGMDSQPYAIDVDPNHPPEIISLPITGAVLNTPYSYDVEAEDADQDPITFSLLTFPPGMTIDANTGLIKWISTKGGLDTVEVQVRDPRGGSETQTYFISTTIDFPPRVVAVNRAVAEAASTQEIILNGSFESASIDPSTGFLLVGVGNNAVNNWIVVSGDIHYMGTYWQASEGARSVDMDGISAGSISQAFATDIGTTYQVRFDLAGNYASGPTIKPLRVSAAGFSQDFFFDVTGKSANNMGWEEKVFIFTAKESITTLTFASLTTSLQGWGPVIDNVRVRKAPGEKIILTLNEPIDPTTVIKTSFTLEHQGAGFITATAVTVDSAASTVTFHADKALSEGSYTVTLKDTVRDLFGNQLDGEFAGLFPSGDGEAGGNFIASFQVSLFGQDTSGPGLVGKVYELPQNTAALPDFCSITPVTTILAPNLDIPARSFSAGFPGLPGLFEWFAIRFSGHIMADKDGAYTFRLTSDDGSRLFIDGKQVIELDGIHGPATKDGTITLTKGIHTILVEYFQGARFFVALQLFWKAPCQNTFVIVPADVLDRPPSGPNAPAISKIEPATGVLGQTVQATIFGSNLEKTSAVVFANRSGSPITATVDQALSDRVRLTLKIPTNTNIGGHAFSLLSAGDALLESGDQNVCFHVMSAPGNLAPVITSAPMTNAVLNSEYTYDVEAQDPNNDPLTFALTTLPTGMAIDSATGLIKWTPVAGQEGSRAVTVQVSDGKNGITTQAFTIQVATAGQNAKPVITSTPLFAAAENEPYTYLMKAEDPDGDFLTFRLLQSPPGTTLHAFTGVLQWTPAPGQAGDHEVKVEVSDGKGGTAGQLFIVRVRSSAPANRPPAITTTPTTYAIQEKLYTYQVAATDPDQDALIFSLPVAPGGMVIDPLLGLIEWTPTSNQVGTNNIVVKAEDGKGGFATQNFRIAVSSGQVNLPPQITSAPSPLANPDVPYFYQVQATDANGDTLTFSLLASPQGMQINATGLISWTPAKTQLGDHKVEIEVADGKGGFARQLYNLRVQEAEVSNAAPSMTSVPVFNASADKLYTYDVEAVDPDNDLLSFSLPVAPTGMTIDFVTGLIQWRPTSVQIGSHNVEMQANDGRGGIAVQQFTVAVSAQTVNLPPTIISVPPLLTTPNVPYKYQVQATDPNRDVVTFTLLTNPSGMNIANGLISWTPQISQLGNHLVEVEANDGHGGAGKQSYVLTVVADTIKPVVNLFLQPARVNIGQAVSVSVQPLDNVGIAAVTLKAGATPLPLDPNNRATFTPAKAGSMVFTATAKDLFGNEGANTAILSVIDPTDVTPPQVAITSPKNGDNVTALTNVIGKVLDQNLLGYSLSYTERKEVFQESDFVEFASGMQNKDNTALGVFDPTMLLNGVYTIRLQAEDINGRRIATFVDVAVSGETKVGNFTLSFTDLSIPVAGIPITVIRTYDSRDKQAGDFGFGWRMAIKSVELKEDPNRNVTVTLPDGRRVTFNFTMKPQGFVPIILNALWEPEPGVTDRLSMIGDNRILFSPMPLPFGQIIGFYARVDIPFECYEIPGYVLTTADGTRYTIPKPVIRIDPIGFNNCGAAVDLPVYDKPQLTEVRDLNGNTLKFTADGIIHSSGKSVTFARDSQGRITQITDPNGNALRYGYDEAKGDLIRFINQEDDSTQFTYLKKVPHHLDKIIDPRGIQPIRNEYDDAGRLVRHIDAFGDTIEYKHNLNTRQEIIVDRNGAQRVLEYNTRGSVVRETDPNGNIIDRGFDAQNNRIFETAPFDPSNPHPDTTKFAYKDKNNPTSVTSITDPEGSTTEFTYNSRSQVLTTKDPKGSVTTNTYDSKGNLIETKDALGNVSKFTYTAQGNVETQIEPHGRITRFIYDKFGNPEKETDALGNETTYTYDANGNRRSERRKRTTPAGSDSLITQFTYDKVGRLEITIDPDTTITEIEYDPLGKQSATIDKLKRRTEYQYDAMGRLTKTIYPDTTTEEATYDPEGRRLTFKDRDGQVTQFEYDDLGRPTKTIYADTTFTRNVYDAAGRIDSTIDARGKGTKYVYDKAGRRTRIIDPLKNTSTFVYDKSGNQIAMVNPKGDTTKFEHDKLNRLVKTIFPDQTFTETKYDSLGRRIAEIDQARKMTEFKYDKLGRLTKVIDALKQETTYAYDEVGNRITQIDANIHTTSFEYDKLGREIKRTLPDAKFETKRYDDAGNLKTRTDFNQKITEYEYEKNNDRLKVRRYPDGSSVSFTYTHTGQRASVTDSRGKTLYTNDNRNRLESLTYPDGRKLEYNYDGNSNRTSLKATIGTTALTTTYTYDDASRLDFVIDPNNRKYDHGYDANGNLDSLAYPNQTKTTYTYDKLNRLRNLATLGPNNTIIQSYQFTLGLAGNREKIEEQDGTVRFYAYDDLYRLTGDSVRSTVGLIYAKRFTYDPVGNRLTQATTGQGATTVNYIYDTRDRLLTENSISYAWDDNGNLKGKSAEATYIWDFENRLIRVEKINGTIVEHAYDADGNRVRTEITPPTGPPTVTNYLVDTAGNLSHVVAEIDDSSKLIAYYVRGNMLLSVIRPTEIRFYHADGLGSIRKLTDLNGNITDSYTYTAFGELLAHNGTDPQPYSFTGEPYDPNIGFQYHRARWMDPKVGRYVGMDPWMGSTFEPAMLHKYLYAAGDPLNRLDPTGREYSIASLTTVSGILSTINAISLGVTVFTTAFQATTIVYRLSTEESYELDEALDDARKVGTMVAIHALLNFGAPVVVGRIVSQLGMLGLIKLGNVARTNGLLAEHLVANANGLVRALRQIPLPSGRIPDFVTRTALHEVKNGARLLWSNTKLRNQLTDYAMYCAQTGREMVLHVRPGANVAPNLISNINRILQANGGPVLKIIRDIPDYLRVVP